MVRVETISLIHLSDCLAISNELLGVNYHNKLYFENSIQQKQGVVLTLESQVVGFLIYKVTLPENSIKTYGIDLHKSVGHIDSICISSSHQKKGFASLLIQQVISILKGKHSSIYTLAWEYNGMVNLEKTLIKFQFDKINQLDSIWKEKV